METLRIEGRDFGLRRIPENPRRPLRAWDGADVYVIDEIATISPERLVIVGDRFGALSCVLSELDPVVTCESAAGRAAAEQNLAHNGLASRSARSILDLAELAPASFDTAVVRIPKSTNELVDILTRLRPLMRPDAEVIGAAMAKHLHRSALEAFEAIVGPVQTSLARKRARLVRARVDPELTAPINPWPRTWRAHGATLVNHGGGFSPDRLDPGTGFLLDLVENFADPSRSPDRRATPTGEARPTRIVDLGCGNGVIGLRVARDLIEAGSDFVVEAIDDSALAIDATSASWAATLPGNDHQLRTHHSHRMVEVIDEDSVDLVVVNPPFHDDRVIGDDTAWSMFVDSHKVLRAGGALIVVGNRHLGYHAKLNKIFGSVEVLGSNSRFVALRAIR